MAKPGRAELQCTICQHPERSRAELLLAGGASQTAVAAKFGMSHDAINRHWKNHVTAERKATLCMGPVQRQELAARVAEESESVLDHHRAVRAGLYHLFYAALDAGDRSGGSLLAGRLTEVNGAIAKMTGELASSPLVQQTNTTNILLSPVFTDRIMPVLLRALSTFPDARSAVVRAFREAEEQEAAHMVPDRPAPALIEAEAVASE